MRRGVVVVVAEGKPRPALVIQRDGLDATAMVMLIPITSELRENERLLRIDIAPDVTNGLQQESQIMIDRCRATDRRKVGRVIGRVDAATLRAVEQALLVFLGIV